MWLLPLCQKLHEEQILSKFRREKNIRKCVFHRSVVNTSKEATFLDSPRSTSLLSPSVLCSGPAMENQEAGTMYPFGRKKVSRLYFNLLLQGKIKLCVVSLAIWRTTSFCAISILHFDAKCCLKKKKKCNRCL